MVSERYAISPTSPSGSAWPSGPSTRTCTMGLPTDRSLRVSGPVSTRKEVSGVISVWPSMSIMMAPGKVSKMRRLRGRGQTPAPLMQMRTELRSRVAVSGCSTSFFQPVGTLAMSRGASASMLSRTLAGSNRPAPPSRRPAGSTKRSLPVISPIISSMYDALWKKGRVGMM